MSNNNNNNEYTYNPDDEDNNNESSSSSSVTNTISTQSQPQSEWEKYLEQLDEARLRKIVELAKLKSYTINGKEYQRNKIKVKNFNLLERMRATFSSETNPRKATEILISIYEKCAFFYLGMSKEEYEDIDDWEEIKIILDACAYRSNRPLPN